MIHIVISLISLTYSANIVQPFDGRQTHGTGVPAFSDVQSFDGYCRSGQPSLCEDSGEFQVVGETVDSYTREQCFDWAMQDVDAKAFSWSDDGKCMKYGGSLDYTHGTRDCEAPVDTRCYVKRSTSVVAKPTERRMLATCNVGAFPEGIVGTSYAGIDGCQPGMSLSSGISCIATCAEGYSLANNQDILIMLCQASGQMSGWVQCIADPDPCVVSGLPSTHVPHTVNSNIGGCTSGLTMSPGGYPCGVSCASGYILTGGSSYGLMTCSSSGQLSGFPTCYPEPDDCEIPPLGLGLVAHTENAGMYDGCWAGHTLEAGGNSCAVECMEGFYLANDAEFATLTCNWQGSLSEMPTCIEITTTTTADPTNLPSQSPSLTPTVAPTMIPSGAPSQVPSVSPSAQPSLSPSMSPTTSPTTSPSSNPTSTPTMVPSTSPTSSSPSHSPSNSPSHAPSQAPSVAPTSAEESQAFLFGVVDVQEHHMTILLFIAAVLIAGGLACYSRRCKTQKAEKDLEAANGSTMAVQGSGLEMATLASMLSVVSGTDMEMMATESEKATAIAFPSPTPGQNSDDDQAGDNINLELVDEISREVVRVDSEDKTTWLGAEMSSDSEQVNIDHSVVDVEPIE